MVILFKLITLLCLFSELSAAATAMAVERTLVSYAIYTRSYNPSNSHIYCSRNVDMFAQLGVASSETVDFVFIIIGDSATPESVAVLPARHNNVKIVHGEQRGVDVINHGDVLREHMGKYDYYVFLNCGARGPYHAASNRRGSVEWVKALTSKMSGSVKAVGSTISCEVSPHIQTFTIALDKDVAGIASRLWSTGNSSESKDFHIANKEVGLSEAILNAGYDIAAVGNHEYRRAYFNRNSHRAKSGSAICHQLFTQKQVRPNPSTCHYSIIIADQKAQFPEGTKGCRGVEPCDAVFVKYGGSIVDSYPDYLQLPIPTAARVWTEDNQLATTGAMCQHREMDRPLPLPYLNMENLFDTGVMSSLPDPENDDPVNMVLIAISNTNETESALLFATQCLHITQSVPGLAQTIWVVLLPVEARLAPKLAIAADNWNRLRPIESVAIIAAKFSAFPYKRSNERMLTLCPGGPDACPRDEYYAYLKYLLADIVFHKLKKSCTFCNWVVVVNQPIATENMKFLTQVLQMPSSFGDFMYAPVVQAVSGVHVPFNATIVAHAVRVSYLKQNCLNHLKTMPLYANVADYGKAPWLFTEGMRLRGSMNCSRVSNSIVCSGRWITYPRKLPPREKIKSASSISSLKTKLPTIHHGSSWKQDVPFKFPRKIS